MNHLEVKRKWDSIYSKSVSSAAPDACHVLTRYTYLLPEEGRALDLSLIHI